METGKLLIQTGPYAVQNTVQMNQLISRLVSATFDTIKIYGQINNEREHTVQSYGCVVHFDPLATVSTPKYGIITQLL